MPLAVCAQIVCALSGCIQKRGNEEHPECARLRARFVKCCNDQLLAKNQGKGYDLEGCPAWMSAASQSPSK